MIFTYLVLYVLLLILRNKASLVTLASHLRELVYFCLSSVFCFPLHLLGVKNF